jgi:hypothetical protein
VVAYIRVTLLNEEGQLKEVIRVDADREYEVNSYFETADGALWLVSDVTPGTDGIDSHITCVWVGKPS